MSLTKEQFDRDIAKHELKIINNEGVYRHIHCGKPGSSDMHFEILTFPGYLVYVGDMGAFTFWRTKDMFTFFRRTDGERTIIGEAASLALTELACKRAGFDNPTLIRDESGAALSPEKRPMWVAMLRRAAQHVNADRVIVISHSEDVQELCDVRMRVANGNVTVES